MDIQLIIGDITEQPDCEAIVNATNPMLMRGAGIAGAIHKKAGIALEEFCEPYSPIKTSEVFVSPGFKLPNKYVVHALGPKYFQDPNPAESLKQTYANILNACMTNKIRTIAVPAISTGSYGFPLEQATLITVETLLNWDDKYPEMVRLVAFDKQAYQFALDILKDKTLESQ
jgi:O-acetyl-ADP-ribose deacetylase (regulator of RNase III)